MQRLLNPRFGSQLLVRNTSGKPGAVRQLGFAEGCYSTQPEYERNTVESPYGPVDIPKMCVTDYIFQGHEHVADKPAVVSSSSERVQVYDAFNALRGI